MSRESHSNRRGDGGGGGGAVISMLGLTSQQIASFVITLLAAGFLSAADYGVYTLAIVFVEFVVMLTYTGYFHFVVTSDSEEEALLSTMFWIMTGIGAMGGLLLVIFAAPLAALFDAPELAPVLRLFGVMQPFASAIGWASAALTRAGSMRRYFLILIATNLGGLAGGCLVLVLWQSLYALVAYRAIRIVLGVAMFGMAVPRLPRWRFDTALAREATSYAGGLYGSRLLGFFSTFGADLILAFLFSTAEAGLYRFANRLAMASVDIVAQPLRSFALKRFGEAARGGRPLGAEVAGFLGANVFLMGGVAITIAVLGESLVGTLFRPEYLAALAALQALAVRAAGLAGNHLIEPVFAARHANRIGMYYNMVWTAIMLAAILVFSGQGLVALAGAQAAVAVLSSVSALWVIGRHGKVALRPAMRNAAIALVLLAVYAVALETGWLAISILLNDDTLRLAGGMALALGLAGVASLAATRSRVFSFQLFAG